MPAQNDDIRMSARVLTPCACTDDEHSSTQLAALRARLGALRRARDGLRRVAEERRAELEALREQTLTYLRAELAAYADTDDGKYAALGVNVPEMETALKAAIRGGDWERLIAEPFWVWLGKHRDRAVLPMLSGASFLGCPTGDPVQRIRDVADEAAAGARRELETLCKSAAVADSAACADSTRKDALREGTSRIKALPTNVARAAIDNADTPATHAVPREAFNEAVRVLAGAITAAREHAARLALTDAYQSKENRAKLHAYLKKKHTAAISGETPLQRTRASFALTFFAVNLKFDMGRPRLRAELERAANDYVDALCDGCALALDAFDAQCGAWLDAAIVQTLHALHAARSDIRKQKKAARKAAAQIDMDQAR